MWDGRLAGSLTWHMTSRIYICGQQADPVIALR
jgi:hypothetical protein